MARNPDDVCEKGSECGNSSELRLSPLSPDAWEKKRGKRKRTRVRELEAKGSHRMGPSPRWRRIQLGRKEPFFSAHLFLVSFFCFSHYMKSSKLLFSAPPGPPLHHQSAFGFLGSPPPHVSSQLYEPPFLQRKIPHVRTHVRSNGGSPVTGFPAFNAQTL